MLQIRYWTPEELSVEQIDNLFLVQVFILIGNTNRKFAILMFISQTLNFTLSSANMSIKMHFALIG